METKEAVRIVLEYVKHDRTVGGFAEAVEKLSNEFGEKTLNFEAESFEQKKFEITVRQTNTITYEVEDFSESLAAKQVQTVLMTEIGKNYLNILQKARILSQFHHFLLELRAGV